MIDSGCDILEGVGPASGAARAYAPVLDVPGRKAPFRQSDGCGFVSVPLPLLAVVAAVYYDYDREWALAFGKPKLSHVLGLRAV